MILWMLALGLLAGRWWKATLVLAAVVWPMLLVLTGVVPEDGTWSGDDAGVLAGGAVLAVANAALGVAVHQVLRWVLRAGRARHARAG